MLAIDIRAKFFWIVAKIFSTALALLIISCGYRRQAFGSSCTASFQGGIQALSRSYFGRIIPKYRSNEYYGFFDILGRYASVMGVALVSGVTALTNNAAMGVLSIGVLLIIGLMLLMYLQVQEEGRFL